VFFVVSVGITKEYNVLINSEELIGTTECDAIDKMSQKLISL